MAAVQKGRKAYLLLAELFDNIIPRSLSDLLKKVMEGKPVKGYQHKSGWWKENKACLSRAPPTGIEIVHVDTKDPSEWSMNLLVKVIKYCNYDLLDRYGREWHAIDELIRVRNLVLDHQDTKIVAETDFNNWMALVFNNGIGMFGLSDAADIYQDIKDLEMKEEVDVKFDKNLLRQERDWKMFVEKLYERGANPTIPQLNNFHSKSGKTINIIQQLAPQVTTIGAFLLNDDNGAVVEGISLRWNRDVLRMADDILHQWLAKGAGSTWNKLVRCIRDTGLAPLAKEIEDSLI